MQCIRLRLCHQKPHVRTKCAPSTSIPCVVGIHDQGGSNNIAAVHAADHPDKHFADSPFYTTSGVRSSTHCLDGLDVLSRLWTSNLTSAVCAYMWAAQQTQCTAVHSLWKQEQLRAEVKHMRGQHNDTHPMFTRWGLRVVDCMYDVRVTSWHQLRPTVLRANLEQDVCKSVYVHTHAHDPLMSIGGLCFEFPHASAAHTHLQIMPWNGMPAGTPCVFLRKSVCMTAPDETRGLSP